jgi:hypothetical protein
LACSPNRSHIIRPNISQAQEIEFIEALRRAKQINPNRAAVIIGDSSFLTVSTTTIEIYRYAAEEEDIAIKKKSELETEGYVVLLINTTNNTGQLTGLPAITVTNNVQQAIDAFLEYDI